jgi:type I restriction enzyme S subunit
MPAYPKVWGEVSFFEAFERLKFKSHEVPSSDYLDSGKYPVVDQGSGRFAGYTNREDPISSLPLIVFGDHTTVVKFIEEPCFIGAQGVVPLRARGCYDPYFLFQALQFTPLPALGYSRHFRELEKKTFPLPPLPEQKKIAEILRTWDDAIEAAEADLKAKQERKRWFSEQFFSPSDRNAVSKRVELGSLLALVKGKKPELLDQQVAGAKPYLVARYIRGEEAPKYVSANDKNAVFVDKDDILIICDGSNSGEIFSGYAGALSSTMARLSVTSTSVVQGYVRHFVEHHRLRLTGSQEGGAIPHLDRDKLYGLSIPVPTVETQRKIVQILDDALEGAAIEAKNIEALRTQKRGLMQKLLAGEVRVAD